MIDIAYHYEALYYWGIDWDNVIAIDIETIKSKFENKLKKKKFLPQLCKVLW